MTIAEGRLDRQQAGRTLLVVVLTMAGAVTFTGVLMVSPLLWDIAAEFHSSISVVGQLVTAGALAWAALSPICGAMSDRCGRKPLLLVGLTTFALFSVLSSFASDLPTLFVGRMLACVGGAFVATNVQASVADAFPSEERGRALGWVMSGFSLAPVLGVPAVAFVAEASDWRWSFRCVGILVFVIALVIYRWLPSRTPLGSGAYGAAFSVLLANRSVGGLMICNLFERITYGAITTYLAAFLMKSYGLSVGQVAPVISLVAVGTLFGNLIGGRVAGLRNPVTVFVVAQSIAAFALPPLMLAVPALWLSAVVAAGFTAANSFSRPSYMWMVTQVGASIRGAMMGLNVMTNQLGMVIGAAFGGIVIAFADFGEMGLLFCATGLLAAISCRLLVRPATLGTVGLEPD